MTIKFIDPISFLRTLDWEVKDREHAEDCERYFATFGNDQTIDHCCFTAEIDEGTIHIDVMTPNHKNWEEGMFFYDGGTVYLNPNKNLIPLTIKIVKDAYKR